MTQATQSAMQATSDGTEKFFVAAATLEEEPKPLTPAETILKALDERVEINDLLQHPSGKSVKTYRRNDGYEHSR